ncbi:MAG: hypothetical protein VB858_04705, partial [Planctomycetaceae bacterium]
MLLTSWLKRLIERQPRRVQPRLAARPVSLGLTRLEERVVLNVGPLGDVLPDDPLATVEVDDGDLVIGDESGQDDSLSITVNGSSYVIESQNGKLIAGNGASQVNGNTIEVSQESVTGGIQVDLLEGEDTLTVDFGGRLDWAPIVYDGGAAGFDSLVINGTDGFATSYSFINAADGTIRFTDGDQVADLTFIGLEPITDNGMMADREFEFTGAAETITLTNDAASGFTFIDSSLAESVSFSNPTNSLTIRTTTGTGNDTINIEGVDAAFDADLIIEADSGDTVRFQTNKTDIGSGNLEITAGGIFGFDTGDAIELETTGTATFDVSSSGTFRLFSDFDMSVGSLDSTSNAIQLDSGAGISTGGGDIVFNTDLATINESGTVSIDAGVGRITFAPITPTQLLEFGKNSNSGRLELSDNELDTLTASVLQLGSNTLTANVFASDDTTLVTVDTLSLINAGSVTQSGSSPISVSNLVVQARTGISLLQQNDVNELALVLTDTGEISFRDLNAVTVSSLDGVTGLSTTNGRITVAAGDQLTVNAAVNARSGADVLVTAIGDLTINAPVISSAGTSGATGDGAGTLTLTSTTGAVDIGSSVGTALANGDINITSQSGVTLSTATAAVRSTGTLSIDADSNNDGTGDFSLTDASASVGIVDNSVTVNAADINLGGSFSAGTGQITLVPSIDSDIVFGNAPGDFTLNNSDLSGINTPLDLTFGTNAKSIVFDGLSVAATSTIPGFVLNPDSSGTAISFVNNPSTFADDFNLMIDLDIATLTIGQDVTLGGGGVTAQGTGAFVVTSNNGSVLNQSALLTVGSGGVSMSLSGSIDITSGGVTTSGPVNLNSLVSNKIDAPVFSSGVGQAVTITSPANELQANVTTAGGEVFMNGPTTLIADADIDTTNGGAIATGGNVTFDSVQAETAMSGEVLSVDAGSDGDLTIAQLESGISLTVVDAEDVLLATGANSVSSIDVQASSTFRSVNTISTTGPVQITADTGPTAVSLDEVFLNGNVMQLTVGADVLFQSGGFAPGIQSIGAPGARVEIRGINDATTFSLGDVGGADVDINQLSVSKVSTSIEQLVIGNAGTQTGLITLDNGAGQTLSTQTSLTAHADGPTGEINLLRALEVLGDFTVNGSRNSLNVDSAGTGTVTLNADSVQINDTVEFLTEGDTFMVTAGTDDIELLGSVNASTTAARGESLTLSATNGNIVLGRAVGFPDAFGATGNGRLGDIDIVAAGTVTANADIVAGRFLRTTGTEGMAFSFNQPVDLDDGAAGTVFDLQNVTTLALNDQATVTTATGGNVVFTGQSVGALSIGTGAFSLDGSLNESGFNGVITGADVTSSATVNFDNAVTMTRDLMMTGSTVSFVSTLDAMTAGMEGLTVTGDAVFSAGAGVSVPLEFLTVTGASSVATDINTLNSLNLNGAVTLTGDVVLNASDILFGSAIDSDAVSSRTLAVNTSGAGLTTFGGAVGGSNRLASVTTNADGQTNIGSSAFNLDGAATSDFGDNLLLTGNVVIDENGAGDVRFSGTVDSQAGSNFALTVSVATGTAIFAGDIGQDALGAGSQDDGLAALTVDGVALIGAAGAVDITTTGNQTFRGATRLANGGVTLTAADVTFESTLDSTTGANSTLLINASGTTDFQSDIGLIDRLASITTDAPGRTEVGSSIQLAGSTLTFNDPVLLTASTVIDEDGAGNVMFNSTVDSEVGSNFTLTVTT